MAVDPQKRQKKLQRRAAKSKAKHHSLMREKSAGLPGQLAAAANFPIVDSLVCTSLWSQGLGWILLSRQMPNGALAYGVFLVDRYCLGVKNVKVGIMSRFDYSSQILQQFRSNGNKTISPATARRFIESAVEYARSLGFHPHADYARARLLFGSIDPAQAAEELEFGQDGKPMFIAGPFESEARCREILATLERSCGPGGSHFTIPLELGHSVESLDFHPDEDSAVSATAGES